MNRIIVTGGAGFIGSAVARHIINDTPDAVCVVDKLTYVDNLDNLAPIAKSGQIVLAPNIISLSKSTSILRHKSSSSNDRTHYVQFN